MNSLELKERLFDLGWPSLSEWANYKDIPESTIRMALKLNARSYAVDELIKTIKKNERYGMGHDFLQKKIIQSRKRILRMKEFIREKGYRNITEWSLANGYKPDSVLNAVRLDTKGPIGCIVNNTIKGGN